MNRARGRRFRERHGNEKVIKWCRDHPEEKRLIACNWIHRHPEKHKKSLQAWRKKNPGKVRDQNRRAKKRRRRRIRWRKWYRNNREVIVAVTCIFCGEVVSGTGRKKTCYSCSYKWFRTTPAYIHQEIAMWPSFREMPRDLLAWKRIIELRKEGIRSLRGQCVL
jgi:hypothetical protein